MDDLEREWNPDLGLYGTTCHHQGIHTNLPQGIRVHALRDNAARALELIAAADDAARARGHHVLAAVLAHQDVDPTSATFGIWGYYAEEPPAAMTPPDYNWADFIGLTLCKLLHRHHDRIDRELLGEAQTALRRAAYAIFRRNVGPGYTNIAVKGAVVTACAGQLLGDGFLAAYGTRRMQRWVDHTREQGINEYNSPTYNWVAVGACEAGMEIATPGPFRAAAEAAHRLVWTSLAEHYHQPTGQVAGPMSRCYSDLLKGEVQRVIEDGAIADPPTLASPCPEDLRHHFRQPVADAVERRHPFQAARGMREAVVGTTWMDATATLATVSRDSLWWQRRCLLAYWRGVDGEPVVAKLRLLKDERDWASAEVRIVQSGPRALFGLSLLTDQGDHHVHLDRPADGRFAIEALRLRMEVLGRGVVAAGIDGRIELSAGGHRLVVHPGLGAWGGATGSWRTLAIEGGIAAELALPPPSPTVDPATAPPLELGAAVEMIAAGTAALPPATWETCDAAIAAAWSSAGLHLAYDAHAQPYAG